MNYAWKRVIVCPRWTFCRWGSLKPPCAATLWRRRRYVFSDYKKKKRKRKKTQESEQWEIAKSGTVKRPTDDFYQKKLETEIAVPRETAFGRVRAINVLLLIIFPRFCRYVRTVIIWLRANAVFVFRHSAREIRFVVLRSFSVGKTYNVIERLRYPTTTTHDNVIQSVDHGCHQKTSKS